jgi:Co/Zn/Cd efflux system component
MFIVWTLILFVVFESTSRIIDKVFVEKPFVMLIAATADLFVNIAIFKVLHGGANHSHGLLAGECSHGHSHDHGPEH